MKAYHLFFTCSSVLGTSDSVISSFYTSLLSATQTPSLLIDIYSHLFICIILLHTSRFALFSDMLNSHVLKVQSVFVHL